MESTLYSVVYFNDDNTVECVPKSWIKNGTCAWPSKHNNVRKMIEQNCIPNKNEFNYYKIRELCSNIKTLAEAQFKARKAQFTSDLSDNDYSKKKKLKKKIPNSTECPIYSDSDSNDMFIIPDNEKKNKNIKESMVHKSVTLQTQEIQRQMCNDNMDPVDQNMSENQLYLMNSQSEIMNNSSVQLKYHESSTPPIKQKGNKTLISETYNELQGNLFEKGSGWSPSPLKKLWSPSPKKSQALIVDVSHPNLNKDPQAIINTADKVQRNLFGKSRSSPSPSNIQWSSPKRKKVNILNNMVSSHENFVKSSTNKNKSLNSPNEDYITNDIEFKKQILRNIMYLKVEIKHIVTNQSEMLEKLQTIEKELQQERPHHHTKNVEFNNYMADYHLPIDNEDDLNILDEKTLNDQEFKNNLIKELSCTGGKNVKSAIKRIMSKLFSNSFLSQYSFSGKKGKKKFCNLFLLPIILKSIKKQLKFVNISDHDIEEPIKTYLAQAPFAEKRKKND